jgi:hypothetical protein
MKPNIPIPFALMVVFTLVFSLSCNAASQFAASEAVPTTEPAPLTEAPEPTAVEQPAERVQLDPCSILTEDEVDAVLGGVAEAQPSMGTGGCTYVLQSEDPSVMAQLVISAAQGNEAKAFTVLSMGLLAGFSGDPNIQSEFEKVNSQVPDLTLTETVTRLAELFRGTAVNLVEADAPDQHATWLAYENELYSQGTLILVRGDEYVSLTQIGGDMETAFEQLGSLGDVVFERLPASFYVIDEAGEGDFSFSLGGGEEEATPTDTVAATATLEPTTPPTEGCVPVLLAPPEGATLDNGCKNKTDPITWEFEWSACPGSQMYGLYVIGSKATIAIIDASIPTTSFSNDSRGYIADQNRLEWRWKVRAMQNGVWGEWTPESTFDVEPVDTDCGTGN